MARGLEHWLDYIETIHPSNWELGLDRIGAVADRLELRKPAPVSVIVAGTNGKGSTCVCLEQALIAAGLTVGCTLSPHVHRFNERVRVNGLELDDAGLCAVFEVIEAGRGDTLLTYFEFTSLAALYCFKQAAVEVAVLEVGLGGRLDAFNIVDADIAVITNIGIDHTDWLGETVELIGAEKAGVLRHGQQVMLGPDMPASVLEPAVELSRNCMRIGREIESQRRPDGRWRLDLKGRTLNDLSGGRLPMANCALALAAASSICSIDETAARAAVDRAWDAGALRRDRLQGPALGGGCRAQPPGRGVFAQRVASAISRCARTRRAGDVGRQGRRGHMGGAGRHRCAMDSGRRAAAEGACRHGARRAIGTPGIFRRGSCRARSGGGGVARATAGCYPRVRIVRHSGSRPFGIDEIRRCRGTRRLVAVATGRSITLDE